MSVCGVCNQGLSRSRAPGVQCTGSCKTLYHFKCANLSSFECDAIESKTLVWLCSNCKKKSRNSLVFSRKDSISDENQITVNKDKTTKPTEMQIIIENQDKIMKDISDLKDILVGISLKVDHIPAIETTVDLLTEHVTKINENIKNLEIKHNNEIIKSAAQIIHEFPKPNKTSFAEIIKHPVMIIQPKDKDQNITDTTNDIRNLIDPKSYNVRGMKPSRTNLVISCKDSDDIRKLQNEAETKLGDKYIISIPKIKLHQIKLVGLQQKYSNEEIMDCLKNQNDIITNESKVNIVTVRENPRGVTVVLEADEDTYNNMISVFRININWDVCRAYESANIRRCLNCQQYNHVIKYCKNQPKCGFCAKDHPTKDCDSQERRCVNCVSTKTRLKLDLDENHSSFDVNCPVYIHNFESEQKRLLFLK